jgi:hypothetical protein
VNDFIREQVPAAVADGFAGKSGDVNGDGKDDLVSFTRAAAADVFVALSNGSTFGSSVKWHDAFASGEQVPLLGDFNGDGKDDIASFTRGSAADVSVALSNGAGFGAAVKWHDTFASGTQVPAVGDFNGDGKDDLVSFTRGSAADAFVALSTGSGFGTAVKWQDAFAAGEQLPTVGDFNGDGKDDVASFTRGSAADVFVATSTGSAFGTSVKWSDTFASGAQVPVVGDFNGDGKDDVARFTRGSSSDVFVATSTGSAFAASVKWHDTFGAANDVPGTGDVNGDGRTDVLRYTRGAPADVFVATSLGTSFSGNAKGHDSFASNADIPAGAGLW